MKALGLVVSDKKIFENCILKTYFLTPWPTYATNWNGLNNFDRGPPRDHSSEVWSKSNRRYQRRCCLKKLLTDGRTHGRRTLKDHKSSLGTSCSGELKTMWFFFIKHLLWDFKTPCTSHTIYFTWRAYTYNHNTRLSSMREVNDTIKHTVLYMWFFLRHKKILLLLCLAEVWVVLLFFLNFNLPVSRFHEIFANHPGQGLLFLVGLGLLTLWLRVCSSSGWAPVYI